MTLDEGIKHAEEVMVDNLEKAKIMKASDPVAIYCFECADEHRQLAEWLMELKRLREQADVPGTNAWDLISRQAAIGLKTIAPIAPVMDGEAVHYEEVVFVRDLEKLPSAEPERKHGHWIMQNDRSKKLLGWLFCSECNAWIGEPTDYCSNCGADMREVDG